MSNRISRRDVLRAGAGSALLIGPTAAARSAPASGKSLTIGIATMQFRELSNRQLARELAGEGIHTIQLFFTQTDSNYWIYGHRSDLAGLTPERLREIADVYTSAGISIHSVGVYATLIHPDAGERKANLDYFERMMEAGAHMGVRTFISEMGHYQPPGPAPNIPYDFQDDVWHTTVATAKELARRAEAHNATVLLEPFYRGLLASAKRTRVFLEEVGSTRVRALLDPANLLEVNDLEEMFEQLGPQIGCLHAKDRKLHVAQGVAAGQGDLDYPKFVALAAEHTPGAPLIMEYVGSKDYRQALAHLRGVMRKTGIAERS